MAALEHKILYKRELMSGDLIRIDSGIVEIGNKTLQFLHRLLHASSGELAASLEGVTVHFDRGARRSTPLPDSLRRQAEQFLVARDTI